MSYAGKIEDLVAERDRLRDALVSAEGEWVGHKELAALRKNDERYRWLRHREVDIRRYGMVGSRASERMDDQIDAAIEEARAVGARLERGVRLHRVGGGKVAKCAEIATN